MHVCACVQEWNDFEVAHGNEDTFREMLRVKRSVVAQYSAVNVVTQELLAQAAKLKEDEKELKKRAESALEASQAELARRKRERPANWDADGAPIVHDEQVCVCVCMCVRVYVLRLRACV